MDEMKKKNLIDAEVSRRGLMKSILGGSAIALLSGRQVFAEMCGATPSQIEGPFYPVSEQLDENNDLTIKDPGTGRRAQGTVIYVMGIVTDERCRPIPKALVELWQANKWGRYDHPADAENPGKPDPDFQYWGRTVSSAKGRFLFKTIIPGQYEAEPGWIRPPHLHFKVLGKGFRELTTQMYFGGHPLNDKDKLLLNLTKEERSRVVVNFIAAGKGYETGSEIGEFRIVLKK